MGFVASSLLTQMPSVDSFLHIYAGSNSSLERAAEAMEQVPEEERKMRRPSILRHQAPGEAEIRDSCPASHYLQVRMHALRGPPVSKATTWQIDLAIARLDYPLYAFLAGQGSIVRRR